MTVAHWPPLIPSRILVHRQSDALLWKLATRAFSAEKDQRIVRGWSKQKIISVTSRMRRSKQNLAYGRIRRELLALLSAREAYFGSWR
jgi:hypothetical protein